MKKAMGLTATALLGALMMTGCASSPKMSEEDLLVTRPWILKADALITANDAELRQPCKSGIDELDAVFDGISELAVISMNSMMNTIAEKEAEKSWADYLSWVQTEGGKNCKAETEKLMQAKNALFMAAMLYVTKDAEADAPIIAAYQHEKDASPEKAMAYVKEHYPAEKLNLAETLAKTETFTEETKKDYYEKAFKAKPMSASERESYLAVLAERATKAADISARLTTALTNNQAKLSEYAKVAAMSFGLDAASKAKAQAAKEALAAVSRAKDQMAAIIKLTALEPRILAGELTENVKGAISK